MNILLAETTKIDGKNAGNKARNDVETILTSMGIKSIKLYNHGDKHYKVLLSTMLAMIKTSFLIRKGELLIIEHPYIPNLYSYILSYYAYILRKILCIKTVVIVHDINAIRYKNIRLSKEISILGRYRYVVVHNEEMQKLFLNAKSCSAEIIQLGFFDYLINEDKIIGDYGSGKIIIAGNLKKEKSGYIYKFPNDFNREISLYGLGANMEELPKCMKYKGAFSPEQLPNLLEGDYGLVWDGDEIVDCVGAGKYLCYNNPHKASLYIVAGKPLIVWNKSAIASYVQQKKLGITVDSLDDLDELLNSVSEEEYLEFVKNVMEERELLIKGSHLKQVYKLINL